MRNEKLERYNNSKNGKENKNLRDSQLQKGYYLMFE